MYVQHVCRKIGNKCNTQNILLCVLIFQLDLTTLTNIQQNAIGIFFLPKRDSLGPNVSEFNVESEVSPNREINCDDARLEAHFNNQIESCFCRSSKCEIFNLSPYIIIIILHACNS